MFMESEKQMTDDMFERTCKNRGCLENRCLDLYHEGKVTRFQFCYNQQKFKGCEKKID